MWIVERGTLVELRNGGIVMRSTENRNGFWNVENFSFVIRVSCCTFYPYCSILRCKDYVIEL